MPEGDNDYRAKGAEPKGNWAIAGFTRTTTYAHKTDIPQKRGITYGCGGTAAFAFESTLNIVQGIDGTLAK